MKKYLMCILFILLCTTSVRAEGFNDKPFSLRFQSALSSYSGSPEISAIGGASAGGIWTSGINPASIAWEKKNSVSFSPIYSIIMLDNGSDLHVISPVLTLQTEKFGAFQFSVTQVLSNEKQMNATPATMTYDMNLIRLAYALHITDNLVFGTMVDYSYSEYVNNVSGTKYMESKSDTYTTRSGLLYSFSPKLFGGIVVDYAHSPSTTTLPMYNMNINDSTDRFALRPGLSYIPQKGTTINLDFQYSSFKNDEGTFEISKLSVGMEQKLIEGLYLGAGAVCNDSGNIAYTTGLGYYPNKNLSFRLAYQYNMFPEIQSEFGRSQMVTMSIGGTL